MSNNVDWYDYNKQKRISLPLGRCDVGLLTDNGYVKAEYLCRYNDLVVVTYKDGVTRRFGVSAPDDIRPLDWNKNQKKPVDLSWLVGRGIDCEFSDDLRVWKLSQLELIDETKPFYKSVNSNVFYTQCRPRMNHPMVLTQEQIDLVPDGFLSEYQVVSINVLIVEFKGLKDGYCYPWEVSNE